MRGVCLQAYGMSSRHDVTRHKFWTRTYMSYLTPGSLRDANFGWIHRNTSYSVKAGQKCLKRPNLWSSRVTG